MGRPERLLFPELNPLHAFAQRLRDLRESAGRPPYKAMAKRTGRSQTALSEAAGGDQIPQWDTLEAFVTFCGGDPDDYFLDWERVREARERSSDPAPVSAANTPPVLANLPRRPAAVFLGRDHELAMIDDLLQMAPNGLAIGPAVHGLGGIGKTEIALQFAHRHQGRFNPVWWVGSEAPESIAAGLAALTRALEPAWPVSASIAATAAWALRWLAANDNWLLVLDNVVDPGAIQPILAVAARGRVIVTTRRYLDWRALGLSPLLISELSVPTSVDLLVRRSGRERDDPELADLAVEMGGLPLALSHAAAYLVERPHVTPSQYQAWLADKPLRVLGAPSPSHPSDALVARTWQVSVQAVAADDLFAAQVLDIAAYLAADAIPVDLFVPLADTIAVEDAAALLASYSLVTRLGTTISIHRLVQTVIWSAHDDPTSIAKAIDLLHGAMPTGDPETGVDEWVRWSELAPHIASVAARLSHAATPRPAIEHIDRFASVLLACAFFHRGQGRYSICVDHYERSLALREAALGSDDPATVTSRYGLAGGYWSIGRFEEAMLLATSTWVTRQDILGPEHPDTLQNAMHVAVGLRELGRLDDAIVLTEATLASMERVLGPDHPDTLRSRNNLAGCYRAAGRHDEAVALYISNLADRVRALGESHPDTLQSRHNLGGGYHAAGLLDEAITTLEETLAARRKLLGPDHPDTSHTRFALAHACQEAGDTARAVALLEQTVRSRTWLLGPDHPDTRKAEAALAEAESRP